MYLKYTIYYWSQQGYDISLLPLTFCFFTVYIELKWLAENV